jgi:hypothetical protein
LEIYPTIYNDQISQYILSREGYVIKWVTHKHEELSIPRDAQISTYKCKKYEKI